MATLIRPEIMSLRQAIRAAEPPGSDLLAFGIPAMDGALGGGLTCGALHEIAAPRESEMVAAAGFALALAARPHKPVLWVAEDMALAESGAPHGPGLDAIGLPPEKLLTVAAPKTRDVLWVMEEALRCPALGAVIGEIRGGADLVATRRLSLAAGNTGALALLLRAAASDEASAATTRWIVGAAPAASSPYGPGAPRFAAHLVRNRHGHPGSWIMEWKNGFVLATDHEPVAAPALDRPHRAEKSAA
jgi:protein ImuA